jgi:sialate O-acetylesterase
MNKSKGFIMRALNRILCLAAVFIITNSLYAAPATDLKLNPLFSDNMVLQRNIKAPIWGTAAADSDVTVKLGKQSKTTKVGTDGKWMVKLDPIPAGGPFELTVSGEKTLKRKNVMIGDVWICSGQSNMQMSVKRSKDSKKELNNANYPNIRLFTVRCVSKPEPQDTVIGKWQECTPKTVPNFSAVGYFFGRDLYKELNIPIGLISTNWGGTRAEAWTKLEDLQKMAVCKPILDRYEKSLATFPEKKKAYDKGSKIYYQFHKQLNKKTDFKDPGIKHADWVAPSFDVKDWKEFHKRWWQIRWTGKSVVWMRYNVNLKPDWAGKDLVIRDGQIIGAATFYYDGKLVATLDQVKNHKLDITIPGNLVKAGKGVIALRIFTNCEAAAFSGNVFLAQKAKPSQIKFITGKWKYKQAIPANDFQLVSRPQNPMGPGSQHAPAGLFNGMINPLVPYGIKGAIWYQGESNAGRAYQYRDLFKGMITCWRNCWKQGDFPFLTVQLANYMAPPKAPQRSGWAELREAQVMSQDLPNTGLAVTIDIGAARDIHPKNKQEVGKRLALAAQKVAYGKNIVYSGPTYKCMKVEGDKIKVTFGNIGGGLVAKGGPLKQFAIAGKDKKFTWADATVDGNSIIVKSDKVKAPVAVRYAWANNPEGCNLYNKENLPAVPFRTDSWKGVTAKNK